MLAGVDRLRRRDGSERGADSIEVQAEQRWTAAGRRRRSASDVLTVTLDVAVLDNKGNPIPKIPQDKFRILEDNSPQKITGYSVGEAPMTICLVVEFSNRFQRLYSWTWLETLNDAVRIRADAAAGRLSGGDRLRYDVRKFCRTFRPTGRRRTRRCRGCASRHFRKRICMTRWCSRATRMQDIEGRKAIVLLSSGVDTFSKLTFDKARRAMQDNGVPIYAIGLAAGAARDVGGDEAGHGWRDGGHESGGLERADEDVRERRPAGAHSSRGSRARCREFSSDGAGFDAQQYTLTYQPTNQTKDGKFRRLKVELVNRRQPAAAGGGRKEQADQGADRHQGRLQSSARSGIDAKASRRAGEVKNSISSHFRPLQMR